MTPSWLRTCIVGCASTAVLISALAGATAPEAAAVNVPQADTAATSSLGSVEAVGPVPTVASGSGPVFPSGPVEVAIMPDGAVASGDRPFLAVPRAMGQSSDVAVRVVDAAQAGDGDGAIVWSGRLIDGWTQVSASLPPGGAYRVDVSATDSAWNTVGWFVVRGPWDSAGSDVAAGGMSVSEVSGRVSWGWQSPRLPGPVGSGSISLGWTSGWNPPASLRQGLPQGLAAGWRIAPGTGSDWASIIVPRSGSIARVVGWNGSVLAFQRNGSGVWVQMTGGAPGFSNELRRVDGDTWEFVAADGVITRFAGTGEVFRASRVFSNGAQISRIEWDGRQRIGSVTNEVGRVVQLSYADAPGSCASQGWTAQGWAAVPAGLLCEVSYPDGSMTQVGYVSGVAGGTQVGMVKDPGEVAATLGWDTRGRLVSERGSFANRAALVDAAAKKVMTTLSYDGQGRAASVASSTGSVQRLTFPVASEQSLRAWVLDRDSARQSAPVTARLSMQATGFELVKTAYLDPTAWVTLKAQDSAGAQMSVELDNRGRVARQIDPQGRVTTYAYNDLGLVKGTTGPSAPGTAAAKTGQEFDTRTQRGEQVDLAGLRALVGTGAARTPEFWAATPGRGGISYSWTGRETGWAGQATGVWDPSAAEEAAAAKAGGWSFAVASEGAQVSFRVGGRVCQVDRDGRCDMGALPSGLKQVTVEVSGARERGWFFVQAGPRGGATADIAFDRITPGYGLVTEATTNDVFPGRTQNPRTVTTYADPASGHQSSVTAPGDLTSRYAYGSGRWERLREVTTPGGASQATTYWPDDAEAQLPRPCGGSVRVSGQVRAITRQDGTTMTSWPDLSDRVAATQLTGEGKVLQTQCFSYFADGMVKSVRTFDADAALVESTVNDQAVNGDFRIQRSTVTKGAGAGDVVLDEVWSQTRSNVLGQVVQTTGSSGVTTSTTYNGLGLPATVRTSAPDGTTLSVAYAYRSKDAQIDTVSVNGVVAAKVTYDTTGRVSAVAYPGGLSQAYAYDPQGRPLHLRVRLGEQDWSHVLDRTSFGRILGERLARDGEGNEQRTYTYDPATGRLTKAVITSGTGTSTSTTMRYGFGSQDAGCATTGYDPGKDGLRTSGARDGSTYVSCHDGAGRLTSTTDPLVTAGAAVARLTHDAFGRVTTISGDAPLAISWGLGTSITRLMQGGDDTVDISMEDFAGTTVLRTVASAEGEESVRFSGPFTMSSDAQGSVGSVLATQYELPGGVQVTASGTTATVTLSDLSGSALATVAIPALAGSSSPDGRLQAAERFGPYGEPLGTAPAADAIRDYSWRSGLGLETLPGRSSITVMGARPYHPGLGEFLTPDPLVDGGDALYAYTSGDPVNFRDPSGGSEEAQWDTWLALIGGGVAALVAGVSAWRAAVSTSLSGARAATWMAGLAGAAAVAGGGYLAVKAAADSDTGLMIAGIAIAAVGATAGITGVVKGVKNVSRLRFRADLLKNPNGVRIDTDWKFEILHNMWIDEGAVVGGRNSSRSSARSSIVRDSSPVEQLRVMKVEAKASNTSQPVGGASPLSDAERQDLWFMQANREHKLREFMNNHAPGADPGFFGGFY